MWTCPNCKIEVEPEFDVCWGCGTSRDGEATPGFDPEAEGIMGAKEYAAETEAKRREDFVTLATFWNAPEAYVVRSRLEAEGIAAIVTDELATSRILDSSAAVKVEVPKDQFEKARRIVDTISQGKDQVQSVIAKVIREGIRTELPEPSPTTPKESDQKASLETKDVLIHKAFRAAIIGLFLFFLPVHIYSLYLLLRAVNFPGEPDTIERWKFWTAIAIDIPVIIFLWLPTNICMLGYVLQVLSLLLRLV